jgi:hypothetical protein
MYYILAGRPVPDPRLCSPGLALRQAHVNQFCQPVLARTRSRCGHASFAVQRDRNALGPRAPLVFLLLHLVFLSTEFSNNSRDVLHSYNGAVPVVARLSAQIISCA